MTVGPKLVICSLFVALVSGCASQNDFARLKVRSATDLQNFALQDSALPLVSQEGELEGNSRVSEKDRAPRDQAPTDAPIGVGWIERNARLARWWEQEPAFWNRSLLDPIGASRPVGTSV